MICIGIKHCDCETSCSNVIEEGDEERRHSRQLNITSSGGSVTFTSYRGSLVVVDE